MKYAGPERKKRIKQIKDRGILEVQGRDCLEYLATEVFGSLWTKVEECIDNIDISGSDSGKEEGYHFLRIDLVNLYRPEHVPDGNPTAGKSATAEKLSNTVRRRIC